VTNKQNILVLANLQYSNNQYSHEGWLSPDRQYFYLGDELDENGTFPSTTIVIDVSNINSPIEVGTFTNGNLAITHNLYMQGDVIYEANYRSGLRVWDASNNSIAPTEVAFFDTYPASDSAEFTGLWSCFPFFGSGIVIGSDTNSGLFVWYVGDALLTFDYPNGLPDTIAPGGETLAVTVNEANPGDYVDGTAMLHLDDGNGFVSIPLTDLGGGSFEAPFPPTQCGSALAFYFTAESTNGITWADPPGAPASLFTAISANGSSVVNEDDMESDTGWISGAAGDDATTGLWVRVDPNGTAAQPEDDHTPAPGTQCWVTGQGPAGGSNGANDVDGGTTTLLSPVFDLSTSSAPVIGYWRWYSNSTGSAPNADTFVIDVSDNGGGSWTNVETVGPGGPETDGGWYFHSFNVMDFVGATSQVRMRFKASDLGSGSIVEAAIDDFRIDDILCDDCGASSFCQTSPNSQGPGAVMSSSGTPSVSLNAFFLESVGGVPNQPGLFYYGPEEIQIPFGDGFRCVGGGALGIFRLNPPANMDSFGDITRQLDFTQPPANAGPGMISPGDTWKFQFWYRDPAAGGSGFNLSNGLSVKFCP